MTYTSPSSTISRRSRAWGRSTGSGVTVETTTAPFSCRSWPMRLSIACEAFAAGAGNDQRLVTRRGLEVARR